MNYYFILRVFCFIPCFGFVELSRSLIGFDAVDFEDVFQA